MRHNGADITVGCMPDIKGPGPQARVPFARPRAEEQRESGPARCRDYDASKKGNAVSRRAEKTAPVWPCEPLRGAKGTGQHPRARRSHSVPQGGSVERRCETVLETRPSSKLRMNLTGKKYSWINQHPPPCSADCHLRPSAATGRRNNFTHPRVGQASRPAIRQPQFRAEARTHFGRPVDRKAERRKKPPMFGPMSRCVPSFGRGQQAMHPRRSGSRFGNLRRPKEKAG